MPTPMKWVYWPVHMAAVRTRHVAPVQHAPLGCGQGLGGQTVPKARAVPPHAAAGTNVHPPSAAQQAELGWGQGFGMQTEPNPWAVPLVHCAAVTNVHEPSAAQQATLG